MLIATSVMPLVADARGDSSAAHAHHGFGHDDHDDGHGPDGSGTGDLAHHAQSHAQTLATACPSAMPTTVMGADVRFQVIHHLAREEPRRPGAVRAAQGLRLAFIFKGCKYFRI